MWFSLKYFYLEIHLFVTKLLASFDVCQSNVLFKAFWLKFLFFILLDMLPIVILLIAGQILSYFMVNLTIIIRCFWAYIIIFWLIRRCPVPDNVLFPVVFFAQF